MKILITGNMGYVGPVVAQQLRSHHPDAVLTGYDLGLFAHRLTTPDPLPERILDIQYFGDVRAVPDDVLRGVDAIVHLAAISNDPIGNVYEDVTLDVNYRSSIALARQARDAGVRSFVFASSCSVYGFTGTAARTESSETAPLTAYARSKVMTEQELEELAGPEFKVTCLRFATACGMSPRLRLDLVLNDFVASALSTGKIVLLSDGSAWRPLIAVKDMARAADWAVQRGLGSGDPYVVVNVGRDDWNFSVSFAHAVQKEIPGADVSINSGAAPDKRSYKVDFALFRSLAPAYQPKETLSGTIQAIKAGLEAIQFNDPDFRKSGFARLAVLNGLRESGQIDVDLRWL